MAGLERTYEARHLTDIQKGYNKLARMLKINAETVAKDIKRLQAKRLINPKKYGAQLKRNKELQKLIKQNFDILEKDLFSEMNEQTASQWQLANTKNDLLTQNFLGEVPVKFAKLNLDALEAFQTRNINGLNLSKRVHNLTDMNQQLYQDYIGSGITQGKSSASIARQLNKINLNPKDVTVFDALGKPTKLSKISPILQTNAAGRGIYRSPLKNLFRLTRTETNAAYRLSDHERFQQLDFVVGIEIHLSGAHNLSDVCDFMAGKYPKDFKFSGFHPQCMCFQTSILKTKKEFIEGAKVSKNQVTKIPKGARRYVKTKGGKLAKNDWYKDNFVTEKPVIKVKRSTLKTNPTSASLNPASGFVEAKSLKEAKQWALDNLDVEYADFKGLDLAIANDINNSVYKIKRIMPNIKTNGIGSAQAANSAMKKEILLAYKNTDRYSDLVKDYNVTIADSSAKRYANAATPKLGKNTIAWSTNRTSVKLPGGGSVDVSKYKGVFVNQKFGKDALTINNSIKRMAKDGWFTRDANDFGYVMSHEIGHEIDKTIGFRDTDVFKGIFAREQKKGTEHIIKNLSKYGATAGGKASAKPFEMIAEAWAEFITSPNPRPLAKEIGGEMLKRYHKINIASTGTSFPEWENQILKILKQ
jgi:DNA-binding Lrp family transcriptional regulator